jgi:hypothetical protein
MKLAKLDVAKIQLETAIELHLDKRAYIPAITLEGAAEEILGKALPSGQQTAKQELSQALLTKYQLTITEKELSDQYLNKTRNNLKHIGDCSATHIEIEPESESLGMLARALTNYIMLSLPPSPVIKRGLALLENAYQKSVGKST